MQLPCFQGLEPWPVDSEPFPVGTFPVALNCLLGRLPSVPTCLNTAPPRLGRLFPRRRRQWTTLTTATAALVLDSGAAAGEVLGVGRGGQNCLDAVPSRLWAIARQCLKGRNTQDSGAHGHSCEDGADWRPPIPIIRKLVGTFGGRKQKTPQERRLY